MIIKKIIEKIGEYALLMSRVITMPDKTSVSLSNLLKEVYKLGVSSIWIVIIISFFIGAVIVMQIGINISSPMLPKFTVGAVSREIIMLEFSSTMICLILAGKVGSNIASEIGSMRITEQIDALDIMGINSANYLILPKIMAFILFMPILVVFSITLGILGGIIITSFTHSPNTDTYIYGLQTFFKPSLIIYSVIKSMLFAFIISSVASYYGYKPKKGSLDVGKASTQSVVSNSILILIFDLIFTQIWIK